MKTASNLPDHQDSYRRTISRFDKSNVARKYPSTYGKTFRERREVAAIRTALRNVRRNGAVLDLPCGNGRLTPLLAEAGFQITAADASPHMVTLAERHWAKISKKPIFRANQATFLVREVMDTGFPDDHFDAVICNRLFHHFNEPETRIAALCELNRICRGTVIVSYFNSFALDAVKFRLKYALRRITPTDRIPISRCIFEREADEAGFQVVSQTAVMWGLSPLWYLSLKRK